MSFHAIVEEFPERRVYRIERAAYRALLGAGVFLSKRAELIRGVIVEMSPQNHPHARAVENLNALLFEAVARRARVRCQLPLVAADQSEPEPDLVVAAHDDGHDDHPSRPLLVVEVADATFRFDRIAKRELYAESGFPEYWIVDVARRRVEVYTQPMGAAYQQVSVVESDGAVTLSAFPDRSIPVAAMFEGVAT